jgi:hypothetical protein
MNPTLGFSISCHRGDLPLLRGCLASIRHFAPDAPICLIVDGDLNVSSLERFYDLTIIKRRDVRDPSLRKWSFGFGITKMVAFWEAPFDIVFHIDADCVMWGDVRKNLPRGSWDVVFNEPHETITPGIQRVQYFDPEKIFSHIPEFPWENNPYFQAGVVVVRRGSLDLDEYMRMLEGQRRHPDIFVNGDQGMLNILVFRALRTGKIQALPAHLQTVVPVMSISFLEQRFPLEVLHASVPILNPSVIHWAGPKPYCRTKHPFSAPMDLFRIKGMRECGFPRWLPPRLSLELDEWRHRALPRFKADVKNRIKSLLVHA